MSNDVNLESYNLNSRLRLSNMYNCKAIGHLLDEELKFMTQTHEQ